VVDEALIEASQEVHEYSYRSIPGEPQRV
jgi:hypothetical protein